MIDFDALPDEWEEKTIAVFCAAYNFALANQTAMAHPKATPMPAEHWNTLCHNMAYVAACAVEDTDVVVVDDDGRALSFPVDGRLQ